MFSGDGMGRIYILRGQDDAKADAHVVGKIHFFVRDTAVALY
jgi:hypothetical protein